MRNQDSAAQSERARHSRRTAGARGSERNNNVANIPVSSDAMSFELAHAWQMVEGHRYPAPEEEDVSEYFEDACIEILKCAAHEFTNTTMPRLACLLERVKEDDLELTFTDLQCAQLVPCPGLDPAPSPADTFETTTHPDHDDITVVVHPDDGTYYTINNAKKCSFTVVATFRVQDSMAGPSDAMTISMQQSNRSAAHIYDAALHNSHQRVIKLVIDDASTVMLATPHEAIAKLCNVSMYPKRNRVAIARALDFGEGDEGVYEDLYSFKVIDNRMCKVTPLKNGGVKYNDLANFFFVRVARVLKAVDEDMTADLVVVRHRLKQCAENGETYYLAVSDPLRSPDLRDYEFLEVEVPLKHVDFKTDQEVRKAFANYHAILLTYGLTPAMLTKMLEMMDRPPTSQVVSRIGKQADGTWVYPNTAFKNGHVFPLEEAGYVVDVVRMQRLRTGFSPLISTPRIAIVPQAFNRYIIGCMLFGIGDSMNQIFQVNEQVAKNTLAQVVWNLNAHEIRAGTLGNRNIAQGFLESPGPGTGKSQTTSLCLQVQGMDGTALGGSTTFRGLMETLNTFSALTVFIDDLKISSQTADWVKCLYDGTVYSRMELAIFPQSNVVVSSNYKIEDESKATNSRLIQQHLQQINRNSEGRITADMKQDWMALKNLSSCLLPDFEQMGRISDNELDIEAITDCSNFLAKAIGGDFGSRLVDEWGKVLFMRLTLTKTFQGNDLEEAIDSIVTSLREVTDEVTEFSGLYERFLAAFLDVWKVKALDPLKTPPSENLLWHNVRTKQKVSGSGEEWVAIRLQETCKVINHHNPKKPRLEPSAVLKAIKERHNYPNDAFGYDKERNLNPKAFYYDISVMPWPPAETVVPLGNDIPRQYPLQESMLSDLGDAALTYQRCIKVKQSELDRVFSIMQGEMGGAAEVVDYRTIIIESACSAYDPYCFYNNVIRRELVWYGWRSLHYHPNFHPFSGGTNQMCVMDWNEDVVDLNATPSLSPYELAKHLLNYNHPTEEQLAQLPPHLKRCMFMLEGDYQVETHIFGDSDPDSDDDDATAVVARNEASDKVLPHSDSWVKLDRSTLNCHLPHQENMDVSNANDQEEEIDAAMDYNDEEIDEFSNYPCPLCRGKTSQAGVPCYDCLNNMHTAAQAVRRMR